MMTPTTVRVEISEVKKYGGRVYVAGHRASAGCHLHHLDAIHLPLPGTVAEHMIVGREYEVTIAPADDGSLVAAIATVLEGFEEGVFLRNVAGDGASGWALRLAPYVAALGVLARATGKDQSEEPPQGDTAP